MRRASNIQIIPTPKAYYQLLRSSLKRATTEVVMCYYAYCEGEVTTSINTILYSLVQKGISVQLTVSLTGAIFEDPKKILKNLLMYWNLRHRGVNLTIVPDLIFGRATHVKFCCIDNDITFVGGSNIADHYQNWTDTNFIFSDYPVYMQNLSTGKIFEHQLLHLINHAKKSISIITWYFVPTPAVINALLRAKRQGVSIRIMYSRSNRFPLYHPFRSYITSLLRKNGISFYEWMKGFNHSKLYWNESEYIAGSPNLDIYSLCRANESFTSGIQKYMIRKLDMRFHQFQSYCYKKM